MSNRDRVIATSQPVQMPVTVAGDDVDSAATVTSQNVDAKLRPFWEAAKKSPEVAEAMVRDVMTVPHFPTIVARIANPTHEAAKPAVIWYHGGQSYSTDATTPVLVPAEQHAVLLEFANRDVALSTKDLERACNNPSDVVKKLAVKFPGTVRTPVEKGDGYFIRVRTKTGVRLPDGYPKPG